MLSCSLEEILVLVFRILQKEKDAIAIKILYQLIEISAAEMGTFCRTFMDFLPEILKSVLFSPEDEAFDFYLFESIALLMERLRSSDAAYYMMRTFLEPILSSLIESDKMTITSYCFQIFSHFLINDKQKNQLIGKEESSNKKMEWCYRVVSKLTEKRYL